MPKLVGACCSIYGSRPRVCGQYRCQILQDLEAGATTFDVATSKVQTARALVEQVRPIMRPGMTLPQVRALSIEPVPAGLEAMDTEARDLEMRLRLAATALTLYIDRHFRNSRDGHMLELNTMDGATEMDLMNSPTYKRSQNAIFSAVGDDILALHVHHGQCYGMQ